MPKYKFKGEPYRHYHTYPTQTTAYDKDGTERTITTFESRPLKTGDVIEMDEDRFKSANLADRFEPAEENEGEKKGDEKGANTAGTGTESTDTKPPREETEWSAVLSQGVNDVKGVISALDNPDDLKALQKEEEKSNSPRKMVLDAIDKRQGELKK